MFKQKILRLFLAIVLTASLLQMLGTTVHAANYYVVTNVYEAEVTKGNSISFSAVVLGSKERAPDQSVTWSIQGDVAAGTDITTDGELTVDLNETAVSFNVIASSPVYNVTGTSDYRTICIIPTNETGMDVRDLQVYPWGSSYVDKGETNQYYARFKVFNSVSLEVDWTVSLDFNDTPVTSNTAVDSNGLLTIDPDETANSFIIKAKSVFNPIRTASQWVYPTVTPDLVIKTEESLTVYKGSQNYFSVYTAETDEFYSNPVDWTVEGNTSSGTYFGEWPSDSFFVGVDETAETITIRATSRANRKKFAEATLTVGPLATVTQVYDFLGTVSVNLKKGGFYAFNAMAIGIGNPISDVTYSIIGAESNNTLVDSNGFLTIGLNETAEMFIVRATSVFDPTVFDDFTVMVVDTIPNSFDIINVQYRGWIFDFDEIETMVWADIKYDNTTEASVFSDVILAIYDRDDGNLIDVQYRKNVEFEVGENIDKWEIGFVPMIGEVRDIKARLFVLNTDTMAPFYKYNQYRDLWDWDVLTM